MDEIGEYVKLPSRMYFLNKLYAEIYHQIVLFRIQHNGYEPHEKRIIVKGVLIDMLKNFSED